MGKRAVIFISSILVLAIAIPGYLLLNSRENIIADPYSAISTKAGIIIETVDLRSFLNSLTTGKGLFGEVSRIEDLSGFVNKLKVITDNLNKPEFKSFFSESHALISFFPMKNGIRPLLSMPVPENTSYRHITNALIASGIKKPEETSFMDEDILRFRYSDSDTAFISLKSGLMIVTNSLDVIAEAHRSINEKTDVRSLEGFSNILLSSGDEADKIYVVFDNLADFIRPSISPSNSELIKKISS
ncbi:MAG TPA: hypothetical protein VHO68_05025, partial [Bacteroidales bacterium]|nr:hypothetical protein [Bacteroidales bacterium]